MKKICIFFTMVLCYTLGMAQNLDRARFEKDWRHLSAYCCAQYEIQYLNFINGQLPKPDSRIENTVRELQTVSLENVGAGFTEVKSFHDKISILNNSDAVLIYSYYDSISNLPNSSKTLDALFIRLSDQELSLDSLKTSLTDRIVAVYAQKSQASLESDGSLFTKLSIMDISFIVCNIILLILLIIVLVKMGSLNDNITDLRKSISDLKDDIHRKNNPTLASGSSNNKKEIVDLVNRITRVESAILSLNSKMSEASSPSKPDNTHVARDVKTTPKSDFDEPSQPKRDEEPKSAETSLKKGVPLYLKNFNAGTMKECTANDAQYELILPDAQSLSGEFTFVGDINSALATKDATFEDVCDLENWSMSSKSCDTVEKGKAEKVSDGKWKVIKKAKVKFS